MSNDNDGNSVTGSKTDAVDTTAISTPYKVLGDLDNANDAIGVLGRNTADSGVTKGVEGRVSSTNGYGLYTPDDAKIAGAAELSSLAGSLTGGTSVTDLVGPGLEISSGSLGLPIVTAGQVLKWDGSAWIGAADNDTHASVSDNGTQILSDPAEINFSTDLAVNASGSTANVAVGFPDRTIVEVDSTNTNSHTTSGEESVFVDTSGQSVTITLSSSDEVDGRSIRIVHTAGNAGTNSIDITGSSITGPNSTTISTTYGYREYEFAGGVWHEVGSN